MNFVVLSPSFCRQDSLCDPSSHTSRDFYTENSKPRPREQNRELTEPKVEEFIHANVFYLGVTALEHRAYQITMFFYTTTSGRFQPLDSTRKSLRDKGVPDLRIDHDPSIASDFSLYKSSLQAKAPRYPVFLSETVILDQRANSCLVNCLNYSAKVRTILQPFLLPPLIFLILDYYSPLLELREQLWKQNFSKRISPKKGDFPNYKVLTIIKDTLGGKGLKKS